MKNPIERIVCAAIFFDDDQPHPNQPVNLLLGFVVTGIRHCYCYATLTALGVDRFEFGETEHGFITTKNRYVDRKEGWCIAVKAGQVDDNNCQTVGTLYSEDLY